MSITRFQTMRRTSMPSWVAVVDVVVDQCGQQVVGQCDGVEVPVKWRLMSSIGTTCAEAAAGAAAFIPNTGPQRGFALGR